MTLYIVAAVLTALVVAILLHPLLRRRSEAAIAASEEVGVYKAQLADIERDLTAGILASEEADLARREVQRRILAADESRRRSVVSGAPAKRLALILLIVLPLAGPGLYLLLGEPEQPAQPHAEREDVVMQHALQERAAEMRRELTGNPKNPEAWRDLAMLRTMLGQSGAAVEAYRQAIASGTAEAEVFAALAEALIIQAEGQVVREARDALAAAMRLNENEPLAHYYIGHALEQDGRYDMALRLWGNMAAALPEGSQWQLRLMQDIERAEAQKATAE